MGYFDCCTQLKLDEKSAKMASTLGWHGLGVVDSGEGHASIEAVRWHEIIPRKPSDIPKSCRNPRRSSIIIGVKTSDLECARQALETPELDVLLYSGELNHIMAKLAKENNVAIAFDFSRVLVAADRSRSLVLAEMGTNAKMARKFGSPVVITSGAVDEWGLRAPRDLISWGKTLGLDEKACKLGVSDAIPKENKRRLGGKWISPGVEME